jgi:hypothetical protein
MADNSPQSLDELTPAPEVPSTNIFAENTPENGLLQMQDTTPPTPSLGEGNEDTSISSNIFLDNAVVETKEETDQEEKSKFVSRYIRRFIIASLCTIINIVLI